MTACAPSPSALPAGEGVSPCPPVERLLVLPPVASALVRHARGMSLFAPLYTALHGQTGTERTVPSGPASSVVL